MLGNLFHVGGTITVNEVMMDLLLWQIKICRRCILRSGCNVAEKLLYGLSFSAMLKTIFIYMIKLLICMVVNEKGHLWIKLTLDWCIKNWKSHQLYYDFFSIIFGLPLYLDV